MFYFVDIRVFTWGILDISFYRSINQKYRHKKINFRSVFRYKMLYKSESE